MLDQVFLTLQNIPCSPFGQGVPVTVPFLPEDPSSTAAPPLQLQKKTVKATG